MDDTPKPPTRLPNGKSNPDYQKWWRATPAGIAHRQKWNQSEAGKAAAKKWQESEKGKKARLKYQQSPKGVANEAKRLLVSCKECGCQYAKADVISRGYQMVGNYACICDLCEI